MLKQYSIPFPHQADYSSDTLVLHRGNSGAAKALETFPAWPTPVFYLWGEARVGKTHIANALFSETEVGPKILDFNEQTDLSRSNAEDLFHLINKTTAEGLHLLILARVPPAGLYPELADLDSRLKAAFAQKIESPDEDGLSAILTKLCADVQIFLAEDVRKYVLSRIHRSVETLEIFCGLAAQEARSNHITKPIAREILGDLPNEEIAAS